MLPCMQLHTRIRSDDMYYPELESKDISLDELVNRLNQSAVIASLGIPPTELRNHIFFSTRKCVHLDEQRGRLEESWQSGGNEPSEGGQNVPSMPFTGLRTWTPRFYGESRHGTWR
jgi:hypothetical protein